MARPGSERLQLNKGSARENWMKPGQAGITLTSEIQIGTEDEEHESRGASPSIIGHSERRAWMTSMRAARAAGSQEATTAAASSTNAERTTGKVPGILTSKK